MAVSKLVLDRQAVAQVFPFGHTGAGGEASVTMYRGTASAATVLLDVRGSQSIAGDLNLTGNLNITGSVNSASVTNLTVEDLTITLNRGGTTAGAVGGGINIEGNGGAVIGSILYDGSGRWTIGDGTTQSQIADIDSVQTFTNKSISGDQITSQVASAANADTVTTNANLTGVVTSVGNTTSFASTTGTGAVVLATSATLVTPNIGVATGTSLNVSGAVSATDIVLKNGTNAFTQSFRGSVGTESVVFVMPSAAPSAGQVLSSSAVSGGVSTLSWVDPKEGTVQSISIADENGVSGTSSGGANPELTITLGDITPSTVNGITITAGTGTLTLGANTLTVGANASISGTNTGDQTSVSGNAGSASTFAVTIDNATAGAVYPVFVSGTTGNQAGTVSSTKLSFNPSTGIITATGFAGSGAGLTGTASSLTAGTVTTNANLTGMVTSVGNETTVVTNANLSGDVTSVGNTTTLAKYDRAAVVVGVQNASNKVFTIGAAVKAGSEKVYMNGQLLTPGASNDYVYDGNVTITFQAAFDAPQATDVIRVYGVY